MSISDHEEYKQRYPTARPVFYDGREYPSHNAVARCVAEEFGVTFETAKYWLTKLGVDHEAMTNHFRPHNAVIAMVRPRRDRVSKHRAAQPGTPAGTAPNGADHVFVDLADENPPLATALAEIGETIGLIRGAYEAREAALIAVTQQLDPAVGPKLAEIENRFARQAASFRALERQLAAETKSRTQAEEVLGLINRKLTQLVHDLRLETPPVPTRRNPTG